MVLVFYESINSIERKAPTRIMHVRQRQSVTTSDEMAGILSTPRLSEFISAHDIYSVLLFPKK